MEAYGTGIGFANTKDNGQGYIRIPTKEELNNYFVGAGLLGGYDPTGHWCGIFQTYLLRKVGIQCHWVIGRGIEIEAFSKAEIQEDVPPAAGKDLMLGDIVVVEHHGHHVMVLEPAASGTIQCIEGNAQGIKYPAIGAYYTGNDPHNVVGKIRRRYRILS